MSAGIVGIVGKIILEISLALRDRNSRVIQQTDVQVVEGFIGPKQTPWGSLCEPIGPLLYIEQKTMGGPPYRC